LKLIETTFGVQPLAARDRHAADPAQLLNLRQRAAPPALVRVASDIPVAQPDRKTLVLGYLVALAVAGVACAVALRSGRGDRTERTVVAQ
jgi:hypothetical protein